MMSTFACFNILSSDFRNSNCERFIFFPLNFHFQSRLHFLAASQWNVLRQLIFKIYSTSLSLPLPIFMSVRNYFESLFIDSSLFNVVGLTVSTV